MAFSMAFSVLTISVKNKNCCTFICVCCRERLFLLWLQNSETLSVLGPEPVTRPPTEPFLMYRFGQIPVTATTPIKVGYRKRKSVAT